MNNREYIGQQIAAFRQKRGLSTRQLSELTGINYANINKIENGKYNVSIDIISRICEVLEIEIKLEEK